MAGFSQEHGDFYSPCFSTSPNNMDFPGPHIGLTMDPLQEEDFQQPCVKEEVLAPSGGDIRSVQATQAKNVGSQSQAAVTAVCQRRKRTVYNQAQLDTLERYFKINMYPDIHHREQLAKQMSLPESRIQVWFQNRRAKARRKGVKSSTPLAMEERYSNVLGDNKYWNSSSAPSTHLSMVHQQQMVPPQQQMQTMRNMQPAMDETSGYMGYPQYSCAVTRDRLMMEQSSSIVYHQNLPSNIHMGNQQPLYNNMTSTMGFSNQVMDHGRGHMQITMQNNCTMDYNIFPANPTLSPENGSSPPMPVYTAYNWNIRPSSQMPAPLPAMQNDTSKQSSPISDSGVSDRSTEYGSDWDEDLTSVLNSL